MNGHNSNDGRPNRKNVSRIEGFCLLASWFGRERSSVMQCPRHHMDTTVFSLFWFGWSGWAVSNSTEAGLALTAWDSSAMRYTQMVKARTWRATQTRKYQPNDAKERAKMRLREMNIDTHPRKESNLGNHPSSRRRTATSNEYIDRPELTTSQNTRDNC